MTIIDAKHAEDLASIRFLWSEYWTSLGLPLELQSFAAELDGLPGRYAPPGGCLLLVRIHEEPAGAAAFRPLNASACEAKRLYVRPQFRGQHIATALLNRLILEAQTHAYRTIFADTLPSMTPALRLYKRMGFEEIGPYSDDPTPGAIYLRKAL